MMLSLVMALCLSAFFVSVPLNAIAKDKKPKTEKKKKDKKPKKDKKDREQEQTEPQTNQQTATPFEVKKEKGDNKQL